MKSKKPKPVYKSEAQREKIRELHLKGQIKHSDFLELEKNSANLKLPKRLGKPPKESKSDN